MAIRDLIPRTRGRELARYQPFTILNELQREVNNLFEEIPRWPGTGFAQAGEVTYYPRVDVDETDEAVEVYAELPGMTEKDVEVSLNPTCDSLILRGEKKSEKERHGRGFYHHERAWGTFERMVPLPGQVQEDKVEATFKDGVLSVHMLKTEEAAKAGTKINVKKAD